MTHRDIERWNALQREVKNKINNSLCEQRDIDEAGGQFDYLLREVNKSGLDLQAEW